MAAPYDSITVEAGYLNGSQGLGLEDALRLEHDDVFNRLLTGATGPTGGS